VRKSQEGGEEGRRRRSGEEGEGRRVFPMKLVMLAKAKQRASYC